MADLSGLGDLVLTVGGDITPLTSALDSIPAAAQSAASQIQAAFDALPSASEGVNQSLANLSAGLNDAGESAGQAMGQITTLPPVLQETAEASGELTDKFKELVIQGLELAGVAITLEYLKESIKGSLEAFGEFQVAAEAMSAMTGNAEAVKKAMEGIPPLANQIGASIQALESAFTKFVRYGVDLQQIPAVLSAIADGAKASGVGFDQAATAWERAANTGVLAARSIQNMGVNMADVARAMGMTGASAADVTKTFKAIQDQSDGTTAATQRLNILLAAMPENLRGLAAASDDVTKTFNAMGNDLHEMAVTIGEALTQLGQAGGLGAFKIALDAVTVVLTGLIDIVAQFVTVAVGGFKLVRDVTEQVATVLSDLFSGNWKKAMADLEAGDQKIAADIIATSNKISDNFTQTGQIVAKEWDDMGEAAKTSAAKTKTAAEEAADAVSKMNQELVNAQNAFDKASAALANGTGTLAAYETALKALNAAQELVNNGFQVFSTVAAMVSDAYVRMQIGVANAQTTLKAVIADMANGTASATQYSKALADLNKAQEELNGGLENAHTAYLLAVDDFSKLKVESANAQTTLNAVAQAVLNGQSSLTQFDAALNKVNADFMATHGGAQDFATVVEMVGVSMQKMAVAASNSQLDLQAWLDKLAAGYPVVQNVIDALDKAAATFAKAHGGVLDLASATDVLTASHMKLELAVTNANTTLSAAYALYDKGKISAEELTTYIDKLKVAQDNLAGVHNKVATAANQAAQAQTNLNNAMHAGADQSLNNVNVENDYATSLAIVEGKLVNIGTAYGDTVTQASNYATGLQTINGQLTTFAGSSVTATSGANDFATSLAKVNGQFVNLAASGSGAASAITAVGNAAASAARSVGSAVGSMASELDRFMGDAGGGTLGDQLNRSMSAKLGSFSAGSLKPGDQFRSLLWNPNVDPSGAGLSAGWGSGTFGPNFPLETQTWDPAAYAKQLTQTNTNLNTAATNLSAAATLQQTAAQTAYDAAKAALVGTQQLNIVTNSLNSSALAAADAANQQAMNNASFASVIANTVTATAGTVQALALATNTMVNAASVVTAVAQKAGIPLTSNTMTGGSVLGSLNLPNVSASATPNYSSGGMPFAQPVFPTGPNTQIPTVNITGGPQFVQSLMNEFVRNLQTQGIRLTRG